MMRKFISLVLTVVLLWNVVINCIPSQYVYAGSEMGGTSGIYITQPSHNEVIDGSETVTIKWGQFPAADHYWLKIMDEDGRVCYNDAINRNTTNFKVTPSMGYFTENLEYKIYVAAHDSNNKVLNNNTS